MRTVCRTFVAAVIAALATCLPAAEPETSAPATTERAAREERVREHQEKIIEERRARKLEEAEKASREPGEGVMLVLGETLTWTEANRLRDSAASDGAIKPVTEETLRAGDGDRYRVVAGPYATRADALSAWRRLSQDMGYTFNTVRTSVVEGGPAAEAKAQSGVNEPVSPKQRDEHDATTVTAAGNVSIAYSGVPLSRIATTLTRESGSTIRARGSVAARRVSVLARDIPLQQALDEIVAQIPDGLWYKPDDAPRTYEIWVQDDFRREYLSKKTVVQSHRAGKTISLDAARSVIGGMLTPGLGKVTVDPQFNNLIVVDLPAVQEKITEFLKQSGEPRNDSSTHGSSGAAPANTPPPQP